MGKVPTAETSGKAAIKRYQSYGFLCGLGLGAIVGSLIIGPYIHEWSLFAILGTIVASLIGGAVTGYLAAPIALGSEARGGGGAYGSGDSGSGSSGDGGGGGGC